MPGGSIDSPDGASLGIQLGSLLGAKVGIHTLLGTALGIVILENNKYTLEITHFTIKTWLMTNIKMIYIIQLSIILILTIVHCIRIKALMYTWNLPTKVFHCSLGPL